MNKLLRLLRYDWPLHFVLLLTNWLPDNTPVLAVRGWLAHFFLGSCGKNLRLGRNITFYNSSMIHLGKDAYLAYGCWLMAGEQIRIGDASIFGPYCVIVSSNHQPDTRSFRYGIPEQAPVTIGSGCWFGAHSTVTAGADIGNRCLVAAGSVVTREKFPDSSMIGGVPARVIKGVDDAS